MRGLGLAIAVLFSGAAGLTWEVLWQHHTGLALGVSAYGTAITLASLMTGLGLGGLLASRMARRGWLQRPLLVYGAAELAIGLGGVLIPQGLEVLASLDTAVFETAPAWAGPLRVAGTALLLLIPATAMGTTIPILAPYAKRLGTNVSSLYALNIVGAVVGVLATTFVVLPRIGVLRTGLATAAINVAVAVWAVSRRVEAAPESTEAEVEARWPDLNALVLAFTSGLAIFALEVSWFRSLRAALQSTTESFAMILAAFLLALALGGWIASRLERRSLGVSGPLIAMAGLAVLCVTPAIDNYDRLIKLYGAFSWAPSAFSASIAFERFAWLLALVIVPATLLGTIFPWLLNKHATTTGAGRLYLVNTFGSASGALLAGFVLLPWLGSTRTSWMVGLLVLAVSATCLRSARTLIAAAFAATIGLTVALSFEELGPRYRVQGSGHQHLGSPHFLSEGPDSTVSVAPFGFKRALVIDGFIAAAEIGGVNFMDWMGHLPAVAADEVRRGLVICFGTGQTADALRQHGPQLDVVDINPAVLAAADYFNANNGVLDDPNVSATVMDGRAYLRRRVSRLYDVITMEPMPPNFAGSNALYSLEFYELMRERLSPGGVAAQWLPFYLVSEKHMRSMVASFAAVFPYTRVWLAPGGQSTMLVGATSPWEFKASPVVPMDLEQMNALILLEPDEVASLVANVEPVTDDNQLLSYGLDRFNKLRNESSEAARDLYRNNYDVLRSYRRRPLDPEIERRQGLW